MSQAQNSWEWNLWTLYASKQLEVAGFTPMIVQCIHQTQGSLNAMSLDAKTKVTSNLSHDNLLDKTF